MKQHNPLHAPIPGLGLRSIKTALTAMLVGLLYAFIPNHDPTFACIGAIFGMGADMEASRRSGGNRFFGTIIGGCIGLLLYWLEHLWFAEGSYGLRLLLLFLGILIMICVCVYARWPGGVQAGGVVLCIILFNTPAHHIDYALWRMVDTGVGVLAALAVNWLISRDRVEPFFPDFEADNAYDIDYERLYAEGFRGIVFDIDNTLVPHGAPATEAAKALFGRLRALGFQTTLLSNNKEPRVQPFADEVGSLYIHKAGKPGKSGYERAMERMGTDAANTFFVGDQLFTDVWGAKKAGMRTYLVKPIHPKEEIQIVLKRILEKIVLGIYHNGTETTEEREIRK